MLHTAQASMAKPFSPPHASALRLTTPVHTTFIASHLTSISIERSWVSLTPPAALHHAPVKPQVYSSAARKIFLTTPPQTISRCKNATVRIVSEPTQCQCPPTSSTPSNPPQSRLSHLLLLTLLHPELDHCDTPENLLLLTLLYAVQRWTKVTPSQTPLSTSC